MSGARRGLFVTFEGAEFVGKSTQARLLADSLRAAGHEVLLTREPGGTPLGEKLREVLLHFRGEGGLCPEAELLLFAASRVQLLRQTILPHLERGAIVIADRFADSTTAYQGHGRGLDLDLIRRVHAIAVGAHWPDLTVLLDLDPAQAAERAIVRGGGRRVGDRFEDEALAFHQRVRDGFLALARAAPERFAVLDAALPVAALHARIMEVVADALARLR